MDGVRAIMLGAQEYFNLHGGTNDAFVTAVYHDVLSRSPDANGKAHWLQQLTNGQ